MHIDILGTISVDVNGKRVGLRAGKLRAMLATLTLDAGHAVSYTDLADELWSGGPLGNTRNALQAHATRLRKIMEGPDRASGATVLRTAHNGYVLDVPRECIDGDRFLDLAGQGSAALPSLRTSSTNSAKTMSAVCSSRLPVGSSASTNGGRLASARATATRCCSPPDNLAGR